VLKFVLRLSVRVYEYDFLLVALHLELRISDTTPGLFA
jgi:hypothetical protein